MVAFHRHMVQCLSRHSFAVVAVSDDVADVFRRTAKAAMQFFTATPAHSKQQLQALFHEADAGPVDEARQKPKGKDKRVGPEEGCGKAEEEGEDTDKGCGAAEEGHEKAGDTSKELAVAGKEGNEDDSAVVKQESGVVAGLWGYSVPSTAKQLFRIRRGEEGLYRWPSDPPEFARLALASMGHLEDLNFACLSGVLAAAVPDSGGKGQSRFDADRLLKSYRDVTHLDRATTPFLHSPFDLFYYHNRDYDACVRQAHVKDDIAKSRSPNCLPHVDPGFLGCIPVSSTPGLMIRDAHSRRWIDVEGLPTVEPFKHVIIFAGWTLQVVSRAAIPAAVHVVRGNSRPRLSLVYERRLEDNRDGVNIPPPRVKRT